MTVIVAMPPILHVRSLREGTHSHGSAQLFRSKIEYPPSTACEECPIDIHRVIRPQRPIIPSIQTILKRNQSTSRAPSVHLSSQPYLSFLDRYLGYGCACADGNPTCAIDDEPYLHDHGVGFV